MVKIAITGSTGMIGLELIRQALAQSFEVTAFVHKASNKKDRIPNDKRVRIIECDMDEYSDVNSIEHHDIFFNLGWEGTTGPSRDDPDVQKRNIDYSLDAVKLAKRMGCSVFVGVGSQAEYGLLKTVADEETPINPQSCYGVAKYATGKMSSILSNQIGMRFCWVRIFSVFGINGSSVINHVIDKLLLNESPALTKCEQVWDFIYVKDAASALLKISMEGKDGETYCLSSGQHRSMRDYLETIRAVIGTDIQLGYGKVDYYPHQPMYLAASIEKLKEDTGFVPKYSFEDAIGEIIDIIKADKQSV